MTEQNTPVAQMREAAATMLEDVLAECIEAAPQKLSKVEMEVVEMLRSLTGAIRNLPLPPEPAMAVKVKPLVWNDWSATHRIVFTATTASGVYRVTQRHFPEMFFALEKPNNELSNHDTLEAAQAAAQADYEGRIRAEIIAEPVTTADALAVPEIAALVEAATRLKSDMLERAEMGLDAISGEEYRIVNAGDGAWMNFCTALAALTKEPKT